MNPQKVSVPGGVSFERNQQSLWNEDRFCSSCGEIIFGQAMDNVRICPRRDCQKLQPHTNNVFKFADGRGRCSSNLCGVILQGATRYCYHCGALNEHYWKTFETEAMKKLETEKTDADAKTKLLEAKLAESERKLAEQDEIIVTQEQEIFYLNQLKDVELESDEEMNAEVNVVETQNNNEGGMSKKAKGRGVKLFS